MQLNTEPNLFEWIKERTIKRDAAIGIATLGRRMHENEVNTDNSHANLPKQRVKRPIIILFARENKN